MKHAPKPNNRKASKPVTEPKSKPDEAKPAAPLGERTIAAMEEGWPTPTAADRIRHLQARLAAANRQLLVAEAEGIEALEKAGVEIRDLTKRNEGLTTRLAAAAAAVELRDEFFRVFPHLPEVLRGPPEKRARGGFDACKVNASVWGALSAAARIPSPNESAADAELKKLRRDVKAASIALMNNVRIPQEPIETPEGRHLAVQVIQAYDDRARLRRQCDEITVGVGVVAKCLRNNTVPTPENGDHPALLELADAVAQVRRAHSMQIDYLKRNAGE